MQIQNVHTREIGKPLETVAELLKTLATDNDQVWPSPKWPRMELDRGYEIGSKGGHGPIRYYVSDYQEGAFITFQFTKPQGFNGTHKLELANLGERTILKHTIDVRLSGPGYLSWPIAVRWLHDALIEDCFDKVENKLLGTSKRTKWSWWVKFLRWCIAPAPARMQAAEKV